MVGPGIMQALMLPVLQKECCPLRNSSGGSILGVHLLGLIVWLLATFCWLHSAQMQNGCHLFATCNL